MRVTAGIFLLIGAAYFIAVLVRILPVGSYKSGLWLHKSTWANVMTMIGIIAVLAGLGIWLIRG